MAIKDLTLITTHLFFCNGGTCKHKGAEESTVGIRSLISTLGLSDAIHTTKTLCNGRCKDGPIIISQPEGLWFKHVTADKAEDFVSEYLVKGRVPDDLRLYAYGETEISSKELESSKAKDTAQ
jgi:(2Fe-2S) ferredoxin